MHSAISCALNVELQVPSRAYLCACNTLAAFESPVTKFMQCYKNKWAPWLLLSQWSGMYRCRRVYCNHADVPLMWLVQRNWTIWGQSSNEQVFWLSFNHLVVTSLLQRMSFEFTLTRSMSRKKTERCVLFYAGFFCLSGYKVGQEAGLSKSGGHASCFK